MKTVACFPGLGSDITYSSELSLRFAFVCFTGPGQETGNGIASVMVKSRTLNAGQSMAHYGKKLYSRLIFHAINILFFVQIQFSHSAKYSVYATCFKTHDNSKAW